MVQSNDFKKFSKVATVASIEEKTAQEVAPAAPSERPKRTHAEPPKMSAAIAAERSRTGTPYITKCLYFPDRKKLAELEALLLRYPRANVSTLVAQLIGPLTDAIQKLPDGQRQVTFEARLWL